MKNTTIDANLCKATITAGIAIVILTVAAVISNDLTIVKLFVTDDARETWENIIASKMLFRIGVFSWLVGFKIGISVKNSRYLTHFCIFWIYHHKWFQPAFP